MTLELKDQRATIYPNEIVKPIDSEAEIKKLQKQLGELKRKNRKRGFLMLSVSIIFALVLTLYIGDHFVAQHKDSLLNNGGFLIEPLSADIVGVNLPWHLQKNGVITVNIENSDVASSHQMAIIKDAILSSEAIDKDGNPIHANLQYGVYYKGWEGALAQTYNDPVKFFMPTKFNVVESTNAQEGDIIIKLINEKNEEGYMGYTKMATDNDHITKATIMVFEINNISDKDLSTVIRHEFGHALGLGHSTDSEDLMHDTIDTKYGYISNCDIHALSKLYEGQESSEIICDT